MAPALLADDGVCAEGIQAANKWAEEIGECSLAHAFEIVLLRSIVVIRLKGVIELYEWTCMSQKRTGKDESMKGFAHSRGLYEFWKGKSARMSVEPVMTH